MKTDDVVLIQFTLAGDEAAFASLVSKYQEQVHAYAYRKIGDFHIAEDITQETFFEAYHRIWKENLRDPTKISTMAFYDCEVSLYSVVPKKSINVPIVT